MKKNILVVDDSTSMRQMLRFALQTGNFGNVDEACDGKEALQKCRLQQFDVVITDINMPAMNGYDFTKELRKLPSFKFTPILILTTESGLQNKKQGKEAGATGWIVKPFDPKTLNDTVRRVLN